MSKEMIELAERIENTPAYTPEEMGTRLPVRQCDSPPGSGKRDVRVILVHEQYRAAIAAALRASAVAGPVATVVNGFRRCPADGETCLCDDGEARGCYETPGSREYPAPAAPVPASVREARAALHDFKLHCRTDISRASFDALKRLETALASLPAPEAAPTREEIAETILGQLTGGHKSDLSGEWLCPLDDEGAREQCLDIAAAILALKSAPAK